MIDQIDPKVDEKLLDIGCGTGTLVHMLALKQPKLIITGLDADSAALKQAKAKIKSLENTITLQQGYAQQTPFENDSFDIAVSSLVFSSPYKGSKTANSSGNSSSP